MVKLEAEGRATYALGSLATLRRIHRRCRCGHQPIDHVIRKLSRLQIPRISGYGARHRGRYLANTTDEEILLSESVRVPGDIRLKPICRYDTKKIASNEALFGHPGTSTGRIRTRRSPFGSRLDHSLRGPQWHLSGALRLPLDGWDVGQCRVSARCDESGRWLAAGKMKPLHWPGFSTPA